MKLVTVKQRLLDEVVIWGILIPKIRNEVNVR